MTVSAQNLFSTSELDSLLVGLNTPQREAVVHTEGPLLILAGAGSGKTRVLTHRIAHLVRSGTANPGQILAITFTNKAATEMRERAEGLLGAGVRTMWLSTFHSCCARILRSNAERLGYTGQFTIYDQSDSRRLIKRCIEDIGADPKRFPPAALQSEISDAKSRLRSADEYSQLVGSFFEQTVAEVYELYERELHRMNALDFDDLIVRTVNLLELFPEVRERYEQTFRYVMVDEYQDTNHAQYRLLKAIAGRHRNIAVVGDDDQSIYAFRGADVRNILEFEEDFSDAKVVKLEQNYRSTQTVLSAASAVVANNHGRKEKQLWSELGDGEPISVRELPDEHSEARFVAGEIERLVDEGCSRSDIAVLYRTNAMSRVIEDILVRGEIPYQVIGGTKFYERAEIKDAIAYLTLLVNPQDQVSFTRIVNSPRRGIGNTTVSRVLSFANTSGDDIWQVASDPEQIPGLGSAAVKALAKFMGTMEELRNQVDAAASVAELLEDVLRRTGYVEALEAERTIEAQGRIENLAELVEVAEEHGRSAESPSLEEFLAQLALRSDQDDLADGNDGLITLMTLHNAKGLEFKTVFMVGMEEGVFPHSRAIDEGAIEEERRLCYVGMTRAKELLYLTYARSRNVFGSRNYGLHSRFIDEVPLHLVDSERLAEDRTGGLGFGSGASTSWNGSFSEGSLSSFASTTGGEEKQKRPVDLNFRLGEDIFHAKFGDGVVTALEPGGIVVVRFAKDRTERKLMADHAPLEKR